MLSHPQGPKVLEAALQDLMKWLRGERPLSRAACSFGVTSVAANRFYGTVTACESV